MRFARPEFLYCLLLIPPLIVFFIKAFRKKRADLNQFGNISLISTVSSLPGTKRQIIKTVFCTLSLILIIISLAQPQSGMTKEKVKGDPTDIVLAMDTSLSMMADDVKPSRLAVAVKEVHTLLDSLKGERVGIVAFSGTALALCPPTADYKVVRYFLDTLDSNTIITYGTSLVDAVNVASSLFDETSRVKAVVFMSDGEEHETGLIGLEGAANKAKADGINIFALGVGTKDGANIPVFDEMTNKVVYKINKQGKPVVSRLEELALKKFCSLTGGEYYRFTPPDIENGKEVKKIGLKEIYTGIHKISKNIPETAISEEKKKTAMIYRDVFQYSISLALIFLLLRILIPELRAGTPPQHRRPAGTGSGAGQAATRFIFIPLALSAILGLGWMPWNPAASRVKEGNRLANEGKYLEAFIEYKEAQQYEPDHPVINFNLGNIFYHTKSYNGALAEFNIATIGPDDEAFLTDALFNRGNTEYRLNLLQKAAHSYKKTLELDPSDQDAKYNLEFVKRELSKRELTDEKKKPPTPKDKKEKKEEEEEEEKKEDDPGSGKKEPAAGGLTGKQSPKLGGNGDEKSEKKRKKGPKTYTPEQAFGFLKAHKPREQQEQKISGWFRLQRKHLEKDW